MTGMNRAEEKSELCYLGIIPKCPFYKPATLLIVLVLIAFGTWGISYLNEWAAVAYLAYSLLFYFVVMPLTMCKHCYFKVTEATTDKETGKTVEKLLSIDEWSESHLHKHVAKKHWTALMFLVWILPIVLVVISFFVDFSILALLALIGFIAVVAGNYLYMVRVKCPTCPIQEQCHSSF